MIINLKFALSCATLLVFTTIISAQEKAGTLKAWEIGLGVTGYHMPRTGLKNVTEYQKKGNIIDIMKRDLLFGGQFYVARELSDHFVLDLQGSFSFAKDPVRIKTENRYLVMASLGFQWRLGEYFNSQYIDPFFRAGTGYMYKNFRINYMDVLDGFNLIRENEANKYGNDRAHLIPLTVGAGINMWLNDRCGIGMQADYVYLPYKEVANSFQGTVRLMWRIGGKTKKSFVEVPIEKIVVREVVREIEKPVYKSCTVVDTIYTLFSSIYFEFDKTDFTPQVHHTLDRLAEMLKQNDSLRFCIIGCTDNWGSEEYNNRLSDSRAKAVVEALIERGVPAKNLKWRGAGKSIAYALVTDSDEVRRGDRKIIVEVVTNNEYWERLK